MLTSTALIARYIAIRQQTVALSYPLSEADMTIQAAEFVSPGKWHLAHTSWFFAEFVLARLGIYFDESDHYRFLFNSYYDAVGPRQNQARRGLITRPGLQEVLDYRAQVDAAMLKTLNAGLDGELQALIELGLQHEQQHQELFLTDTLYNLAQNPMFPAYLPAPPALVSNGWQPDRQMLPFAGGLVQIGHDAAGFAYDNELPRHQVYVPPFALASHPVSNRDWLAFMADEGYRQPHWWLADGWQAVQKNNWQAPLYWQPGGQEAMTLYGLQPIELDAPVSHISYFEADAYARWAGQRLPTEAEWEVAASLQPQQIRGHFSDSGIYRPQVACRPRDNPSTATASSVLSQLYGDVWEWTASPYSAYPGYRIRAGAVGEYNGKFMNGQYVLRGGSCATPAGHIRASYRNFFYPHMRWQFSGLRLAADLAP